MTFKVDFDPGQSISTLTTIEARLEAIASKATQAAGAMAKITGKAEQSAKPVQKLATEVEKLGTAAATTQKKVAATNQAINNTGRSSKYAAQEAAAFRAAMNALGTHMGIFTGQTIAVAAVVYSVVSAMKAVVATGTEFTGSLARANGIMGATAGEAQLLEEEVRHLGETTVFTATQASEGLIALAMAGLSAAQAIEALEPALNLAIIGNIDMYKSADILTNVMNGFRLEAEHIPAIVDDLATAITSSNATIEQMGTALSYVAPVAAAAGAEITEVVAILEVFHNAGIKGSRAGTALRRAYVNLQKPSAEATETLLKLGVATHDVNGNMLDMNEIMKQLAKTGVTSADMIALFGVRALPAMEALLSDLRSANSEFEVFRANLQANEGAAKTMRERFEDYLGSDAKKFISALQEKSLVLFEFMEKGLRETTQAATEFVQAIDVQKFVDFANKVGEYYTVFANFRSELVSMTPLGALYDYIMSSSDEAAESVKGLTAEMRDLEQQQKLNQEQGRKEADIALKFVERGPDAGLDKIQSKYVKEIKNLDDKRKRYALGIQQLAKDVSEAPELAKPGSPHQLALKHLADQYQELSARIGEESEKLQRYMATGLTDDTVKRFKELDQWIANLNSRTFKQETTSALEGMAAALDEISSKSGASMADIMLGREDEIASRAASIRAIYEERKAALEADIKKFDPREQGKMANEELFKEKMEDMQKLTAEYNTAMARIGAATTDTSTSFEDYIGKSEDMIKSGQDKVKILESEIQVLRGVAAAEKTAGELKREALILELETNAAKLEAKGGKAEEVERLRQQAERLREVNAAIREQQTIKQGEEDFSKLEKDFKSGKHLTDKMKAEMEYTEALLALNEYRNAGLLESDQALADAKQEIYNKMIEDTNQAWFDMGEAMSKTIGDNVAQAITMQQTWEETTDNIKKAIIGGIVGALVKEGTQMAANAILHTIFGEKRKQADNAMTAQEVSNAAARTAAAETEAKSKMIGAVAGQGGGDPYTAFFRMAAMQALVTAIPPMINGLFGTREIGGPVMAGQSYLVGEKGPEIFTPTAGGAITSNADIRRNFGQKGGETVVHNTYEGDKYYINAIDTQSFQEALAAQGSFLYRQNREFDRSRGRG